MSTSVHLLLPRSDAKQIQEGRPTRLLFPIDDALSTPDHPFRWSASSDAQFPARTHIDQLPTREGRPAWITSAVSEHGYIDVSNAGRLWNFLGDATHSTQLLQTPHGLAVGQELTIENRYNVPATPARVTHIELIRVQSDGSWFWLVELLAIG
jgi:hypothetical protein